MFWAGNPAIHLFDVAFLRKVTQGAAQDPLAPGAQEGPSSLMNRAGSVEPAKENALKFERFIFDVLPLADRWTVVATSKKEFEPLKNATGPDSPATVRQALCDQAADWLEARRREGAARCQRPCRGAPGDQPSLRPGRGRIGGQGGPQPARGKEVIFAVASRRCKREGHCNSIRVFNPCSWRTRLLGSDNVTRLDHGRRRWDAVLAAQPAEKTQAVP